MRDESTYMYAFGSDGGAAPAWPCRCPRPAQAQSGEPIKIGFGMALTGPLAANGKQALLGMKIWEEEINAKGGLLGRPVKLVYFDDQSNPSTVPGIYTKLIDVDKVDLVLGGYATNMVAPAMPVVMQKGKTFISLFALDVNHEFKYPKYFSFLPTGPTPKESFTEGFFQVATAQQPKPTTVALVAEDAEFSRNACDGARANSKKFGLKIVYDKTYPPNTTDYTPIVRALQAANADLVVICSYPLSSVGMVQAANELELQAEDVRRRHGRAAGDRVQEPARGQAQRRRELRDLGAVREDDGAGGRLLQEVPGACRRRGRRSARLLSRRLGLRLHPRARAMQFKAPRASTTTRLPTTCARHEFKTIMGDVRFGPGGEWTKPRIMQVQYHDIKEGARLGGHELPDRAHAGRPQDRKRHLPVREGEVVRQDLMR